MVSSPPPTPPGLACVNTVPSVGRFFMTSSTTRSQASASSRFIGGATAGGAAGALGGGTAGRVGGGASRRRDSPPARAGGDSATGRRLAWAGAGGEDRSEEHTSELQSLT